MEFRFNAVMMGSLAHSFLLQLLTRYAITMIRVLLEEHTNRPGVRILAGACVLLVDSCEISKGVFLLRALSGP
jgi:hypothetical protein